MKTRRPLFKVRPMVLVVLAALTAATAVQLRRRLNLRVSSPRLLPGLRILHLLLDPPVTVNVSVRHWAFPLAPR